MAEHTNPSSERQIIAKSLRTLGTIAMKEGRPVPIGNSFWSSDLYRNGIFPAEGTIIETRMSLPTTEHAPDWLEGGEVVIHGEEILALGDEDDRVAPVHVRQSLEYAGEDANTTGGFDIFHDVFPDRVERHAQATLGPKTDLSMGEEWFKQHGVDMLEVVVTHLDEEPSPSANIPVTLIPAAEFATLAAQLA